MGKTYYYFAATLPSVQFAGRCPLSLEEFLEECERLLDKNDYLAMRKYLTAQAGDSQSKNPDLQAYFDFERQLRNMMAAFRAQRAHKDPHDYIRGGMYAHPGLTDIIGQAAKDENLYRAEKLLDSISWDFLQSAQVGHYFDFEFLVFYGLQLKILNRYQKLESTAGQEKYQEIKTMDLSGLRVQKVQG